MDSHSSGICVAAYLKQPTRIQCGPHLRIPIWSCSERGLPCHGLLPAARCALTAPFHPYRRSDCITGSLRRFAFCCTFRRFTPPRRYLALCPMEPGLSSPMHRAILKRITQLTPERLSSQLRRAHYAHEPKSTSGIPCVIWSITLQTFCDLGRYYFAFDSRTDFEKADCKTLTLFKRKLRRQYFYYTVVRVKEIHKPYDDTYCYSV